MHESGFFLLRTGELRCPSTYVVVSRAGMASKATNRVLHTRPVSAKNQQAQEAQVSPQQHFSRGVSVLLLWHSVPPLLPAVAAVAADGEVSNKSLPSQHFV